MTADVAHLKSGGTNAFAAPVLWPQWMVGPSPFTEAKLCRAHRHGGAIPWSMVTEIPNPNTYTLPAPSDTDVHYVTEVIGHSRSTDPDTVDWFLTDIVSDVGALEFEIDTGVFPYDVTVSPSAAFAGYMTATQETRRLMVVRPEPPTLSADDWFGLSPGGEYHQHSGPDGDAVVGSMDRMMLIKPTSNGLNAKTCSAQVQYFSYVRGGPDEPNTFGNNQYLLSASEWSESFEEWTITAILHDPMMYPIGVAAMLHGWLYANEIDPETGKVLAAHSIPDGTALIQASLRGEFDYGGTYALCITWPNGFRKFTGYYNNFYGSTDPPKLMWRPAGDWVWIVQTNFDFFQRWVNVDATAIGGGPLPYIPDYVTPKMWRGYTSSENIAARGGTGAWKELCTFAAWDNTTGELGDPTWSADQPTAGQEIIVTAFQPDMMIGSAVTVDLNIYPEATVSPVAIPVIFGGVIQGGTP